MPSQNLDAVLGQVRHLIDAGAALHWLKPQQKRPVESDWTSKPRYSEADLRRTYRQGYNIGIRLGEPSKTDLGYLHLIDLDIRKPELAGEAWAALLKLWPGAKSFPSVMSGSGGESRHIYLLTDKPFSKTGLARSKTFSMIWDDNKQREVRKNDWEIDLLGTGAQAVLPPSIHPDTGLPYRWERPLNLSEAWMGIGPTIPAATVAGWGANAPSEPSKADEDDELMAELLSGPLDLDEDEIERIIGDLPEDWVDDRESWVRVGAALHHQYQGSQVGFERWCKWSKESDKFDAKDSGRVWRSFKKDDHRPVRMATLIQAANAVRLNRENELTVIEAEPQIDLSDLFGDGEAGNAPVNAESPVDPKWKQKLQYGEKGDLKATAANISIIVQNDPRVRTIFGYNEFTHSIRITRDPKQVRGKGEFPAINLTGHHWRVRDSVLGASVDNEHISDLRVMIDAKLGLGGYGVKAAKADVEGAIARSAMERPYHPVRDYLESTVWDGVPRASGIFVDYLKCPDTPYHRQAGLQTLLGAVVRIYEPGHKFDFVPILEGITGKGKSTFIAILGHGWFSELVGDISDNNKMIEQMQGSWILEIPELQGFSRADMNDLKAFISRQVDKGRLAWERGVKEYPRQCIFIGSTNDEHYLRDITGGRRFWPIVCGIQDGQIDNEKLRREIGQIWAEAVNIYKDMRACQPKGTLPLFLSDGSALQEAEAMQEAKRVESPTDLIAARIEQWLNTPIGAEDGFDDLDGDAPQTYRQETCTRQIWHEALGNTAEPKQTDMITIGQAMTKIRWSRTDKVNSGPIFEQFGRVRTYIRHRKDPLFRK